MNKRNLTNSPNASDKDGDILQGKKMKSDPTLEQEFINYISIPSLETIAITKLVVELCKQPDLRDEILYKDFDKLEEKMAVKLDILPKLLKDKASNIIQPIGMQICDWSSYVLNDDFPASNDYKLDTDYICWTMEGTIDKKKTLELLIDNEVVDNIHCIYIASCRYCAKDRTAHLWELSQKTNDKELFYSKHIYESYKYHLVAYWTCFVKNELPKLLSLIKSSDHEDIYDFSHSININMLTLSVSEGNALAVKYFWRKLTEEEKHNNIMLLTELVIHSRNDVSVYQETNEYTEILCYLLSQMHDVEQQRKIFKKYSGIILKALFFDWRWRKFLLPTIQVMWDFLDGKVYTDLLSTVLLAEIKEGMNMVAVNELWCNSPADFKIFFVQHGVNLCYRWMWEGEWQLVKTFLDLFFTSQDQIIEFKKLLISGHGADLCRNWLLEDKWQSVENFFYLFYISQDKIDEFKKLFITEHGAYLCYQWMCNDNWESVKKFDDLFYISEDQIDEFKSLVIGEYGPYLCYQFMCNDKWESVEKFLDLFYISEDQIDEFKKLVIKERGPYLCYQCMWNDKWQSVENFLDLFFFSQSQIDEFKSLFIRKYGPYLYHRWNSNDKLQSVKKFLDLFFTSQDQVDEFKNVIIRKYGEFLDLA